MAEEPATASVPETPRLLSSNSVDGVPVFSRDGDRLGSIAAFMIDRFTGRAEYAVILTGTVLGLGGSYHPVPWDVIHFDTRLQGYALRIDKGMFSSGPAFKSAGEVMFDAAYSERLSTYYGARA